MHFTDKAIESIEEDELGRKRFAKHLADKICSWDKEDSLAISLSGKWGSGKTSILTMVKIYLAKRNEVSLSQSPTVIEFNPWYFSGEGKLTYHFYNELAKELKVRSNNENDKKIANQLQLYSAALDAIPGVTTSNLMRYYIVISGVGFIVLSVFPDFTRYVGVIGVFLLILSSSKTAADKLSKLFEKKSILNEKTILGLKGELSEKLRKREKKILVIIDDIDRLNRLEIKQIFQLIKINSDLPNILYLLSMDKRIVEKNVADDANISGKHYLKKIVQVDFSVPSVQHIMIEKKLDEELKRIVSQLPYSFDESNNKYWNEVLDSDFYSMFETLRDVKRFVNSLEFNLSLVQQSNSIEINPVDFIVIEAIRIWHPRIHLSMSTNKNLLTTAPRVYENKSFSDEQLAVVNLLSLAESDKEKVKNMLYHIFPQCKAFESNHKYTDEQMHYWSKQLRVCSSNHFDSYFTLIPGGNDNALSQYDIDSFIESLQNSSDAKQKLILYSEMDKLEALLRRLPDFTKNYDKISEDSAIVLINILFEIYDTKTSIPNGNRLIFSIVDQLIMREQRDETRYKIMQKSIQQSSNVLCAVSLLQKDSKDSMNGELFSEENRSVLKKICITKLKEYINTNNLLCVSDLPELLAFWEESDEDTEYLTTLIKETIESEDRLLIFIKKLTNLMYSSSGSRINFYEPFYYPFINKFIEIKMLKSKIEAIKKRNSEIYVSNKEIFDLFLDKFPQSHEKEP